MLKSVDENAPAGSASDAPGQAAGADGPGRRSSAHLMEKVYARAVRRLSELRAVITELGKKMSDLDRRIVEKTVQLDEQKRELDRRIVENAAELDEQKFQLSRTISDLDREKGLLAAKNAKLGEELAERQTRFDQQLAERQARFDQQLAAQRAHLSSAQQEMHAVERRLMRAQSDRDYLLQRYPTVFDDPSTSIKSRVKTRMLLTLRPLTEKRLKARQPVEWIRRSPFFDRNWYLQNNPAIVTPGSDPATHYLVIGGLNGLDPGPLFSSRDYYEANPDVAAAGLNPLLHYIQYGKTDGRPLRKAAPAATTAHASPHALHRRSPDLSGKASFTMLFVSGEAETPGNKYRVTRYVDAAIANGASAGWISQKILADQLDEVAKCDVLVFWRAGWDKAVAEAFEIARLSGIKVVFDVDDLMVEPALVDSDLIDGIRSQDFPKDIIRDYFVRIRRTMLESDICTTTTNELAFFMRWAGKTTHVLPNGFDRAVHDCSRAAARRWRGEKDGLVRIGYAGGSRTHQRDFSFAIAAIARILRENAHCRLVLFQTPDGKTPLIDVEEYPELDKLGSQIEWRSLQPLEKLPNEMARFDINLAPLEISNPFCEAKSELKVFEAALVNVVTVASPTGPFRRAIDHGVSGLLAATGDDWYHCLDRLIRSPELRERLALQAYHSALAKYGPLARMLKYGRFIEQLKGGQSGKRAFALDALLARQGWAAPKIYPSEVIFEQDKRERARVTVVIPLYNYQEFVVEALDSVFAQTLSPLDLVIVDGCSTDNSLGVAHDWAKRHAGRFNRIVVLKNQANIGLGFCRNSGFSAADTDFVLPLDADNRLLPECCETLLAAAEASSAAYVYPTIRHFGASTKLISNVPYDAQRFVNGNFVDALALVSKEAWALVGGYDHVRHGWEDYDMWARLAETGLAGEWCDTILAEYRVHPGSMMTMQTKVTENYRRLHRDFERRHPWVWLQDRHSERTTLDPDRNLPDAGKRTRLDDLLAILRCPATGLKLIPYAERTQLISVDGSEIWPVVSGRAVLARDNPAPVVMPPQPIAREFSEQALHLIRGTTGSVLSLGAGESRERFDHVVEVDQAIFRHTDVVADTDVLPFDDACFDAVLVVAGFARYRNPPKVAAELFRVLKPGGTVLVGALQAQPAPGSSHVDNPTADRLSEWFKAFEMSDADQSATAAAEFIARKPPDFPKLNA